MRLKLLIIVLTAAIFATASRLDAKPNSAVVFKLSGYVSCLKTSAPLDKAIIKINGKKSKIKTDGAGYYELDLTVKNYVIVFSKKGYKEEEITVKATEFDQLERKITRNINLCPVEKNLKIRGRLIDRITGDGVKAELRVNDEIVISDYNGYFECETYEGDVRIKTYSKAHRPYSKIFKKNDIASLEEGMEIFLQRYTFYSIVSGSVLEKKEKTPVYEAVVEIAGKRVLTDNYGCFEMELNESGDQKIVCTREGFEKINRNVKIKAGKNKVKIFLNIKEKGLIEKLREKYEKENIY